MHRKPGVRSKAIRLNLVSCEARYPATTKARYLTYQAQYRRQQQMQALPLKRFRVLRWAKPAASVRWVWVAAAEQ